MEWIKGFLANLNPLRWWVTRTILDLLVRAVRYLWRQIPNISQERSRWQRLIFSLLATAFLMYFVGSMVFTMFSFGFWVCAVVVFTVCYIAFSQRRNSNPEQPETAKKNESGSVMKLNPIKWQAFRVIASAAASLAVVLTAWLSATIICYFLGTTVMLPFEFWAGAVVILTLVFALSESKPPEVVPETNYLALVTFWGMPLPIYRTTGDYSWLGTSIGLGRSTKVSKHSNGHQPDFTDLNGFIPGGDIPFVVWNSSNSQAEDRATIQANAKNDAVVKATLVLVLQFVNPRRALDSEDPALDIGNRARQEIREMFRAFVDTDIPNLLDAVGPVLEGKMLLTYFLPEPIGVHKQGSMIKTSGENAIFYVLTKDEQKELDQLATEVLRETKLGEYKAKLRETIRRDAAPVTLQRMLGETVNDDFRIDVVRVKNPIDEVIVELGLKLNRVTIGSITLPEQVTVAAAKASAESHERAAQVASARTNQAARAAMLPTAEELANPGWRDAMMVAAAGDNPEAVKVIHVPGLDILTALAGKFLASNDSGGNKT